MTTVVRRWQQAKPLLVVLGAGLLSLGVTPAGAQSSARDQAEARRHIRLLRSKDTAKLKKAYAALIAMGDRASHELALALGHRDKQVRSYASAALQRTGEPAVDDVVPMLGQSDRVHRSTAAHTLVKIGANAVPLLVTKLGDRSDALRGAAVETLVLIGEASAPAVTAAAKGGSARVREAAAYILKKLGKPMPPGPAPAKKPPAKVEPKPKPKPKPKPQPKPQPRQPVAEAPKRKARGRKPNLRKAPRTPAVPGARSRVDDGRAPMTVQIVKEIETLMQEGKPAEARVLLWGVWAQAKRVRHWASLRRGSTTAIDALYQRAHDACYRAAPVLSTTDGEAELADAIEAASSGLNMGDMGTAGEVLEHLNARAKAGVQLGPKSAQAANELFRRYNTLHVKFGGRLNGAMPGLVGCVVLRGKKARNVEQSMHDLYGSMVDLESGMSWERVGRAQSIVMGVLEDLAPARKGLEEFSAKVGDPLQFDRFMRGALQADPGLAQSYAMILDVACAAVYGERQLKAWDLPQKLGRIYLDSADGYLSAAETAYQYNKGRKAEANLANFAVTLSQAKSLGLPADVLARRTKRMESIKASAGSGKLRRARSLMKEAEAALARATRWGAKDADEKLASAKGWIKAARKAGIPAAEVDQAETRLKASEGKLSGLYADLAAAQLELAEGLLTEARKLLGDAEGAFSALTPLDRALALRGEAVDFASHVKPPFDAARTSALKARATKLAQDAALLRESVVTTQRVPSDVYKGSSGARWRRSFRSLAEHEYQWKVLAVSISEPDWKNTTARYESSGGGNTKIIQTRWYRKLFAWVAVADPADSERAQLRYLGFRLHKFTDGSYRQLKLYWVGEPVPMLRANLPK